MGPPKAPRHPETGEPLEAHDLEQPVRADRRGKYYKSLSVKLAEAKLKRLTAQNKKLTFDYKAKAGGYVLLDDIKRQVLAANVSVKNQVLAVIETAALSREQKLALKQAMVTALNDLAYERSRTPTE